MALKKWLSEVLEGHRIFKAHGLGELHVEITQRDSPGWSASIWESKVYCKEHGSGPLCMVLHLIEETREDLVQELVRIMPPVTDEL